MLHAEFQQIGYLIKSVQVCFNYETNKAMKMPEVWKNYMLNFEDNI